MSLITLAQSLYAHSAPLRVGFVFVMNHNTSVTGLMDASVAINNAYHYFADTRSSKEALYFLTEVGHRIVFPSIRSRLIYKLSKYIFS